MGETNLKTVNYNFLPDASRFTINHHLAIYLTTLHNLPSWARIFKLYIKAVLARSKNKTSTVTKTVISDKSTIKTFTAMFEALFISAHS